VGVRSSDSRTAQTWLLIPLNNRKKKTLFCRSCYLDGIDISNLLEVLRVLCGGCIGNEPVVKKKGKGSTLDLFLFLLGKPSIEEWVDERDEKNKNKKQRGVAYLSCQKTQSFLRGIGVATPATALAPFSDPEGLFDSTLSAPRGEEARAMAPTPFC
jgi:hypothetical protein